MTRPWNTPCARERYLARLGLQVDPWRLDECTECEYCGSCVTHICYYRNDDSTLRHLDHFPAHLVPSQYPPRPCNLPAGHGGRHRTRHGWSWPVIREEQPS